MPLYGCMLLCYLLLKRLCENSRRKKESTDMADEVKNLLDQYEDQSAQLCSDVEADNEIRADFDCCTETCRCMDVCCCATCCS